jgi:hypothetical protein
VRLLKSLNASLSTSVLAVPELMLLLALGALLSVGIASGCTAAGSSSRFRNASLYRGARPSGVTRAQSLLAPSAFAGSPRPRAAHPAPLRTRSGAYARTFRRTDSTRVVRAPRRACGAPASSFCPPRRVAAAGACDGSVAG